jgi:hypothetical protein
MKMPGSGSLAGTEARHPHRDTSDGVVVHLGDARTVLRQTRIAIRAERGMNKGPAHLSEDLPMFLKVNDLQRLLQVSKSEAYFIAHTIGVIRLGKRLIRVPRESFLRWRTQRILEAERCRQ